MKYHIPPHSNTHRYIEYFQVSPGEKRLVRAQMQFWDLCYTAAASPTQIAILEKPVCHTIHIFLSSSYTFMSIIWYLWSIIKIFVFSLHDFPIYICPALHSFSLRNFLSSVLGYLHGGVFRRASMQLHVGRQAQRYGLHLRVYLQALNLV